VKKLLVLLPLISSCGSTLVDDMDIDSDLRPHVEQFFVDCENTTYRRECDIAKETITSIRWGDLKDNTVGVHRSRWGWMRRSNSFKDKALPEYGVIRHIVIDPQTSDLKSTIYHELGHAIDQEHDDRSCIMGTYITQENIKQAKENWDRCVKELFTKPRFRKYE
jgi:hypothetical protein